MAAKKRVASERLRISNAPCGEVFDEEWGSLSFNKFGDLIERSETGIATAYC
jgi:hypothetical protein